MVKSRRAVLIAWIMLTLAMTNPRAQADEGPRFCFSEKSLEALVHGKANENTVKRVRRNLKNFLAPQQSVDELIALEEAARLSGAPPAARQTLLEAGQFTRFLNGPIAEQAILDALRETRGLTSATDLANYLNELPFHARKPENHPAIKELIQDIITRLDKKVPKLDMSNLHETGRMAKELGMKPDQFRVFADAWDFFRQSRNHDAIAEAISYKLLQPPSKRVVQMLLKRDKASPSAKAAIGRWTLQARERLSNLKSKLSEHVAYRTGVGAAAIWTTSLTVGLVIGGTAAMLGPRDSVSTAIEAQNEIADQLRPEVQRKLDEFLDGKTKIRFRTLSNGGHFVPYAHLGQFNPTLPPEEQGTFPQYSLPFSAPQVTLIPQPKSANRKAFFDRGYVQVYAINSEGRNAEVIVPLIHIQRLIEVHTLPAYMQGSGGVEILPNTESETTADPSVQTLEDLRQSFRDGKIELQIEDNTILRALDLNMTSAEISDFDPKSYDYEHSSNEIKLYTYNPAGMKFRSTTAPAEIQKKLDEADLVCVETTTIEGERVKIAIPAQDLDRLLQHSNLNNSGALQPFVQIKPVTK